MIIQTVFSFICVAALAQSYDPDAERTGMSSLTQSGKLFQMTLTPSSKQLQFEFAGHEAAKVEFKIDRVEATYATPDGQKRIQLVKVIDPQTKKVRYVLDRPAAPVENLKIQVSSPRGADQFTVPPVK